MKICDILHYILLHTILIVCSHLEQAIVEFNAKSSPATKEAEVLHQDGHIKTSKFSFCVRFMTHFNPNFFLIDTNQVSFWLEENRGFIFLKPLNASSRNDVYSRMFQFCKTYIPGYWMSICFTVKLDRETQEMTFFQDGAICSREKYIDGDFEWVFLNPSVSLKDIINHGGNNQQNHVKIAHLYFWYRDLTEEDVAKFAECGNSRAERTEDLLFDWDKINTSLEAKTMSLRYERLETICQTDTSVPILIAIKSSYEKANHICENLGGAMALDFNSTFLHKIGDPSLCSESTKFWIPVVRGEYMPSTQKYQWLKDGSTKTEIDFHHQNWGRSQPNGNGTQYCVGVFEDHEGKHFWDDLTCDHNHCFVCTTPKVQTYYLRGPGNNGISKDLDRKYSLMIDMQQPDELKITFEGQGGISQIVWDTTQQKSYLKRYDNEIIQNKKPRRMLQFEKSPFGHQKHLHWMFTNCNPQNQFTCDNGHCLPIDKRCNMKIDCQDKSDENFCRQIYIDEHSYRKSIAPENPYGQSTLEVGVWFEIMDVVEINEPEMYFSLRFNVWLKWIDARLQYQNLDEDAYENVVPEMKAAKLWLPTLYFKNSIEGQILNYDSSSQIMIFRNGDSKKAPLSQLNEAKIYNSSETQLKWTSHQFKKFKCKFDLYYLPFDNQTCVVKLKVPATQKKQIHLTKWGMELDKHMVRTLNQYVVTNCSTETHNYGIYLVVKLQRRSGPFWFSLFIPSICLIVAAEVALFINETHFEAMIMVSLTSNLVMYTLYSSVQAELPEDSGLKLIDIWLLHGLVMPMVVFIVLAVNELMSSKIVNTKNNGTRVSNSAVIVAPKNQDCEESHNRTKKTCMLVCKALIPITSIIFMSTFFAVCHIR